MLALSAGQAKSNEITQLDYQGPIDPWVQMVVAKKYETLYNLYEFYDVETFLELFELVLVLTTNEALISAGLNSEK